MPLKVPCPKCKTLTLYDGNPYRPFCSERCKKMDLGAWASGDYVIPGKTSEVAENNPGSDIDTEFVGGLPKLH